jgi:hypothetical protein
MRCIACNKNLSDFEATRRHAITNEFLDTCTGCLGEIQRMTPLPTIDRKDLDHDEEYLVDDEYKVLAL